MTNVWYLRRRLSSKRKHSGDEDDEFELSDGDVKVRSVVKKVKKEKKLKKEKKEKKSKRLGIYLCF